MRYYKDAAFSTGTVRKRPVTPSMLIFWTFLTIPHNGKLCDPLVYFLKKERRHCLPFFSPAIQQRQLLESLQAENHGIKHYYRQHHCMPPILCLYPQGILFLRHSPASSLWNSFLENGRRRRTIVMISWREAA
ncbi:hypothetical protein [Akkermansia muciniphila]|uniref:hypothetical protein n=1 Tax=Akkermansia muciniphila TaxID=239935 RepID=UPI0011782FC9|nr:hypothetical protein [Akkermansia muciniphila]